MWRLALADVGDTLSVVTRAQLRIGGSIAVTQQLFGADQGVIAYQGRRLVSLLQPWLRL
jgi:hypothetical protein